MYPLNITALDGGQIDLSALRSVTQRTYAFSSRGSGSRIDLGQFAGSLGINGSLATIDVRDGGVIHMPLVTAWNTVNATITNDGQIQTGQLTSIRKSTISLDGEFSQFRKT